MKWISPKTTNTKPFNFNYFLSETKIWNKMTKFVAITYNHAIMRYDEIEKKPYHFTLERIDPDNENVPEAVIPEDKCLYFQPEEMLELRNFYKREGRDAPFESLQDYAPDSYDEDWWALLDHLYSCTAIDMIVAETAAASDPVINRDALVARLLNELPYSLDDYDIIAPQELIDDVLDDNFTDWVGIRNRIDLDNALADADFYDYEGK